MKTWTKQTKKGEEKTKMSILLFMYFSIESNEPKFLSMDADESDFLSFPHEPAGVARKLRIKKNYEKTLPSGHSFFFLFPGFCCQVPNRSKSTFFENLPSILVGNLKICQANLKGYVNFEYGNVEFCI